MLAAFYLDTDLYYEIGLKAVEAVRKVLPEVKIVHLTDKTTTALPVDTVLRFDFPDCFYGYKKCWAAGQLPGDTLFLDTDCIVQKDVSGVFKSAFDAAVCLRHSHINRYELPFNGGVVFSRSQEFWMDVAGKPEDHRYWRDTESRFARVALSRKYDIKVLDGMFYNRVPENEAPLDAAIVHYKGWRKKFIGMR